MKQDSEHTYTEMNKQDDLDDLDDYLDEFQDEVFAETDAQQGKQQGKQQQPADNLKDTIEETLNRLKTKDEAKDNGDVDLEELLKGMSLDGDIGKALMESMGVLMSRQVLYEPLRDITVKYPDWLETHRDTAPPDDYARYEKQYKIVQEIVDRFDADDYDEQGDKEFISDKLDQMEQTGNPPEELLGEFANVSLGDDELEGCEQQ